MSCNEEKCPVMLCYPSLLSSYYRMHHRQLSRPRRTGFKMHQAPPIVEPSHTPTSHPQTPRPSMTQKTSSGVLVLYDLVDISSPSVKRPPFAKKHPSSDLTLAEFKDKIFSRKGDYRCVCACVWVCGCVGICVCACAIPRTIIIPALYTQTAGFIIIISS